MPQDRVRKFTEENKQLAAQLHEQMKALQGKPAPSASKSAKTKGRANGSDFSSARGSEERGSMAAQGGGRAPRRLRDYDLEQVCEFSIFLLYLQRHRHVCGVNLCPPGGLRWANATLDLDFTVLDTAEMYACTQVRISANLAERWGKGVVVFTMQPQRPQTPKFQQDKIGASPQQPQAKLHHVATQTGGSTQDDHSI